MDLSRIRLYIVTLDQHKHYRGELINNEYPPKKINNYQTFKMFENNISYYQR